MTYRYLDLRRPEMQTMMRKRIKLVQALRRYLDARGFQDIETPILTKATPEGARDYLVPSRVHPGQFYALPQSPQLFKQILMMAGFDRYYQIARCFRDEDLRADRQPEFTQLDLEFAFVEEKDVQDFVEELIRHVFKEVQGVELDPTFPRMTWAEAMRRFGSDKPDLRIALELVDIADAVKHVEFKVFAEPANAANGRVAALRVPGGATLTRKEIDLLTEYVGKYGAKGLAWLQGGRSGQGPRRHQFAGGEVPRRRGAGWRAQAHRCAERRHGVLRCGQLEGGHRLHGRVAPESRQGSRPGREQLEAVVGHRLPDVRVRRGRRSASSPCITRSRRRRSMTSTTCAPMPRTR